MRFAVPTDRWPGDPVTVEKRKWDGSVSARWPAVAGVHRDGVRLWRATAGTVREHPSRGTTGRFARDEVTVDCGAGWLLTLGIDPLGATVSCRGDAVIPPVRSGPGLVTFVDLDLDLDIDPRTGEATLLDEEDLLRRAREMRYPDAVVRAAWEGIDDLWDRLRSRRWPFTAAAAAPPDARAAAPHAPRSPAQA